MAGLEAGLEDGNIILGTYHVNTASDLLQPESSHVCVCVYTPIHSTTKKQYTQIWEATDHFSRYKNIIAH